MQQYEHDSKEDMEPANPQGTNLYPMPCIVRK